MFSFSDGELTDKNLWEDCKVQMEKIGLKTASHPDCRRNFIRLLCPDHKALALLRIQWHKGPNYDLRVTNQSDNSALLVLSFNMLVSFNSPKNLTNISTSLVR